MIMPASVTHYLFAERVLNKLKQTGAAVTDRDAALIGAQGPDVFFFHRVMPCSPASATPGKATACTTSARPAYLSCSGRS